MARPRKALETNKKHFTKEERQARAASEKAFKVDRAALEDYETVKATFGLSDAAIGEYTRIVQAADWLDDLDRNDLAAYVIYWERATKIATSPDARREVVAQPTGGGGRKIVLNPLWVAFSECEKNLRSISSKLGLDAIDRLKLVAPTPVEEYENKFITLMMKKGK